MIQYMQCIIYFNLIDIYNNLFRISTDEAGLVVQVVEAFNNLQDEGNLTQEAPMLGRPIIVEESQQMNQHIVDEAQNTPENIVQQDEARSRRNAARQSRAQNSHPYGSPTNSFVEGNKNKNTTSHNAIDPQLLDIRSIMKALKQRLANPQSCAAECRAYQPLHQ